MKIIQFIQENQHNTYEIPFFMTHIAAGFPSPAQDFIEKRIDFNQLMIKHPTATYVLRITNDLMNETFFQIGDLIIVDSSQKPKHGDIVIANIQGEFIIKKLCLTPTLMLKPIKQNVNPIMVDNPEELNILGVVTYIIYQI